MTVANRILPLNYATTRDNVNNAVPRVALQSITMAIRVGPNQFAIGYIQEFGWSADRDIKMLHQIEPYPNGTFDNTASFADADFYTSAYWPGEPIEGVPGKIDGIKVTLKRYALYSSNLLAALSRLCGAGTEDDQIPTTNDAVNDVNELNKYVTLIQQVRPIDIYQMYINPTNGAPVFGRKFEECWFTSLGETLPNAETNEPVLEEGEMTATRIRPFGSINGEVAINEG